MAFIVRTAQRVDHALISAVLARLDAFDQDALPPHLHRPGLAHSIHALLLDPDHAVIYLAEEGSKLVGLAVAALHAPPNGDPRRVSIAALVIRGRLQREGLGRVLMGRVHRWAEACDAEWIDLRLPDSQQAVSFYSQLGYARVGRHRMVRRVLD